MCYPSEAEKAVTQSHARPRIELNGPAPDFEANTTQGVIRLSEWEKDKWVILFSHPADFTPVCTTEFVEFAKRYDDLQKKGVALIGCSIDSIYSHIAWVRNIEQNFKVKIKFPVIADLDQKVSQLYGMVHTPSATTATVRCVYFIDPKRSVRAMVYYPLTNGRFIPEIIRLVKALQTTDKYGVATPANWQPGEKVVVPAPATVEALEKRLREGYECKEWYLCFKHLE
jgi:peroxiredoxin (alkyl hydroperoxide reductase subunit C)